jgi:hypothetical protein
VVRTVRRGNWKVLNGKGTEFVSLSLRTSEVFACPASIPFSYGNATLPLLSVHDFIKDNITYGFCGWTHDKPSQSVPRTFPGHRIFSAMKTWLKVSQWELSWELFLELLRERLFSFGVAKLEEYKPGAAGNEPGQ